MGKIIIAFFFFFLSASTLAIHEARPLPAPEPVRVEPPVTEGHSPRALHDAAPPWVRLASPVPPAPITPPPVVPPRVRAEAPEVRLAVASVSDDPGDNDSGGCIPDRVDRCPDQPEDDADDDGCPEPANGPARPIVQVEAFY
ncbi:MAG: hypothetical protein JWN44_7282 [Myxococcales bacterium]|nr:hypothetical protein [Myxococcales bacterium]